MGFLTKIILRIKQKLYKKSPPPPSLVLTKKYLQILTKFKPSIHLVNSNSYIPRL